MFCCRKHEECVKVNGKFYHETHSKCHDCQTELDHNTMLVFHNGVANCKACLQKSKDQQKRQHRLELIKALEDSKNCVACRKPIVAGEVCVKLTFELGTGKLCLTLPYYAH